MQNLNNAMHVVYASDDRFAEILGVSLCSLYDSCCAMNDIVVYVLDSGISAENKEKLSSITARYNRSALVWIPATNISDKLQMEVAVDRGSLSQYARLFVSSVLPQELKRVLYLDCDIIINKDLSELWNLDMEGKTIAALMDAFSRQYRPNIGLKGKDIMFNSGVMLIDLMRWKSQNIEEKLMQFIAEKKGVIQQGDQGALNAVLSHDTYCFNPKYNSETVFYDFSYKEMMIYRDPPEFYPEEEIRNAVENPVIIHYTTSFLSERPWVKGCAHRYTDRWLHYKAMTPWKDAPLWEPKKASGAKKAYLALMGIMPRGMAVWTSGMLHRYGRPLLFKMKG